MGDTAKEIQETFVDIKQSYVDEKLKEFFSAEAKEVNIDNICLFASKTIEEYNAKAETKLKGKQKLEASVELAKSVIERSVAFVPKDVQRQVIKNIYHNIDAIEQTIQFIVDISNNPNIVNFGKWVENTKRSAKNLIVGEKEEDGSKLPKKGLFSRCFGCAKKTPEPKEVTEAHENPVTVENTADPEAENDSENGSNSEEKPTAETLSKKEAKKKAKAEKLRKKLEELSMTPEEKEAKKKAEQEAKKKAEQEEIEKKKAEKEELERKKREEEETKKKLKVEQEAEKLRKKLEELSMTPEEKEAKKKAEQEAKKKAEQEEIEKKKAEKEELERKKREEEAEKLRKKLEIIEGPKKDEVEKKEEQKEN